MAPSLACVEVLVKVHKYEVVKNLVHLVTLALSLCCLSIGHPNWLIILETDEYLEKSFITNLATLL